MGPERSSHPCWNHPGNTAGSLSRLKAGGRLPEHRNFLLLIWPMRLLARRRGLAQRAPLVSMGLERRKSASHLRLQSQMKGFWARCLSRGGRLGMKDKAARLCWWPPGWGLASSWQGPPGPMEKCTSWGYHLGAPTLCQSLTVGPDLHPPGPSSCPFKPHSVRSPSTHVSLPLSCDRSGGRSNLETGQGTPVLARAR